MVRGSAAVSSAAKEAESRHTESAIRTRISCGDTPPDSRKGPWGMGVVLALGADGGQNRAGCDGRARNGKITDAVDAQYQRRGWLRYAPIESLYEGYGMPVDLPLLNVP